MDTQVQAKDSGRRSPRRSPVLLALFAGACVSAHAAAQESTMAAPAAALLPARHRVGATLDERVGSLTKALGLDASQQAGVRKALEDQRDLVSKAWSDNSVPGAFRVKAVQAIGDLTADRIRALLNDEQKKKYKPPRPANAPTPGGQGPGVEAWMDAIKQR